MHRPPLSEIRTELQKRIHIHEQKGMDGYKSDLDYEYYHVKAEAYAEVLYMLEGIGTKRERLRRLQEKVDKLRGAKT